MNLGNGLKCAWLVDFMLINGNFCHRMFLANIHYKACSVVPDVFVNKHIYISLIVKFVDDDEI